MAKDINKQVLMGHLGADPEISSTGGGVVVATARLATSDRWKDKATGERRERTQWHRLKFFGPLAEVVQRSLMKGSHIYVEGSFRSEPYTDKDGVERYSAECVVNELNLLDPAPGAAEPPMEERVDGDAPF